MNIVRTVTSWHDTAKRQPAPLWCAQQQGSVCADRSKQQSTRFATDKLYPQRLTARQQRSALRSAAHHRLMRLRVLRRLWLAVRFTVLLSRLSAATRALRGGPSPGKRRLSPSPDEQHDPLLHTTLSCSDGASERPEVARSGWVRRVLSRVGLVWRRLRCSCENGACRLAYSAQASGVVGPLPPQAEPQTTLPT